MHLRTFSHVSFAFEPFSSIYLLGFFSHSLFFYYPNFTKFPPAANRSINTRRMLRNWSWLSVLNLVGVWRMGVNVNRRDDNMNQILQISNIIPSICSRQYSHSKCRFLPHTIIYLCFTFICFCFYFFICHFKSNKNRRK